MRNPIKIVIIFLIHVVEYFQYWNRKINISNPLDKFADIIPVGGMSVRGKNGWIPISDMNATVPMRHYYIELDNGFNLECADHHILIDKYNRQRVVSDIQIGEYVYTKQGFSRVCDVHKRLSKTSMYDLSLDSEFLYYTNDILSHNTVSAAIYILWFITFRNDKGVMVVANKGSTTIEIVDKIKSIYRYLPFFLKKGVINWNQRTIAFDNGCRIKTETRSKEPAIGFTIDLLYFDEFAKVPENILRPYYGSAVPTISAMENSKIIITSTPQGYNLFYDLCMGAMKPEGDPDKNEYIFKKVLWHQVKGRQDVKIIPRKDRMEKYSITLGDIIYCMEKEHGFKTYQKNRNGAKICFVEFDLDDERTHINSIRKLKVKGVSLLEIASITNWKEEQINLIGGEAMFRQEFGIEFITGDKLLFDEVEVQRLETCSAKFDFIPIPQFDKKMPVPYENLRWITNIPDLFNILLAKKYYVFAGIDMGEGLGQDYTVFNIFRLMMKNKDFITKNRNKFGSIYDFFQLEQIGNFRSNIYSPREFAQLFYLVMFTIFDPEKCKVALELNGPGATLLAHLPHVFEGNNDYSSSVFARYKHTIDAKMARPGLKVSGGKDSVGSKKAMIKNYQDAIYKQNIIVHDPVTIHETKTFTRHDLPSGDYTFKAQNGHDDSIMSVLNLSTIFDNVDYKNIVDNFIATELSETDRKFLEDRVLETDDSMAQYYTALINNRKKFEKPVIGLQNGFRKVPMGLPPAGMYSQHNFDILKKRGL